MCSADIYSVTEITRKIRYLLETSIPTVWIRGELSNFTHHTSGHMYFTLKDEECQIKGVMWREDAVRLFFTPQNGMKLLAQGDVSVYERAGHYQLRVRQMQPMGIGELQMAFERLKAKLLQEGLFAEERKKPLPQYPTRVGIVSSPTGAALRDVVEIIHRRLPGTQLVLNPVKVQGEGAAEEIAQAINAFNSYGKVDVIIVTRGGGSLEDLWAFNEESVARAIFDSEIPVVSAVGHEVDVTIADFVADVRAPTPSAAAEMVVPDRNQLVENVRVRAAHLKELMERKIASWEDRIESFRLSYGLRRPFDMIEHYEQRCDELVKDLSVHVDYFMKEKEHALVLQRDKLEGLNPLSVLRRGYSICRTIPGSVIIREAGTLNIDDQVEVMFHRGTVQARVEAVGAE